MARQLRIEFPGAIYHVTCRMIGDWHSNRTYLFKDSPDRERFIKRLGEKVEEYDIRLYLFVLMANHFHLVFSTPKGNCSRFMHALSTAYTVYYNLRHNRHGHLLDGRYKAKLVEGDTYLLALSRYVHLNPVRVSTVRNRPLDEKIQYLRNYPWSSYPGYIERRKALDFIDYEPMYDQIAGAYKGKARRYREFVESRLLDTDDAFVEILKESPRSIGSDAFHSWVNERYQQLAEAYHSSEDISFRHVIEPLPPEVIINVLAENFGVECDEFYKRSRDSFLRAVAAHCLCRYAGVTQREAATILHIGTGAAISHQRSKLAIALAKNRRLRRLLNQVEDRLKALRALNTNSRADPI